MGEVEDSIRLMAVEEEKERLRAALKDMVALARSEIEVPTIAAWDRIHAAESVLEQ